jgi:DNA-binding MarR family transcriptional regulator
MGHTRWLNDEEKRAWTAFTTAHALLYRRLEQQLKRDFGLSGLQYEILARLSGAAGREMRMAELAGVLVNSKSGLTYQIEQMEKAGLVRRRSCPSDDRAVFAVLTEEGMALLERAAPGHVETVRELFIDVLTPDQVRRSPTASARRTAVWPPAPAQRVPRTTGPHARMPGPAPRPLPASARDGASPCAAHPGAATLAWNVRAESPWAMRGAKPQMPGSSPSRACSAQMVLPVSEWRVPQPRVSWATSSRPRPPSS